MSSHSGKFVLRVSPQVHSELKREATQKNLSLNQIVNLKIKNSQTDPFEVVKNVFHKNLLAIVLFGSTVRAEAKKSSDIDLLVVLDTSLPIERSLYTLWDQKVESTLGSQYSPQFSHIPKDLKAVSSLWLEIAMEGEIIFDTQNQVRKTMHKLKNLIASGYYVRKVTHGHPYWVRNENE